MARKRLQSGPSLFDGAIEKHGDPQPEHNPFAQTIKKSVTRIEAVMHFDGGCEPNPGPAKYGFVIRMGARVIECSEWIGEATCNTAEYRGLIAGLERSLAEGVTDIEVYGDSQLIIFAMQSAAKGMDAWAKKPHLRKLRDEAWSLAKRFSSFAIYWVGREENVEADALASCK